MENKKRFLKSVDSNNYVNALNEMGQPCILLVQDENSSECKIIYKINEEETIEETIYISTSGNTSGSTSGYTSGSTSGGTIESGYTSGNTSGYTSGSTSGYTSGGTYEAVDLGLPSGNLWAKYNIGATSETEVGYYFQWGDEDVITTSGVTDDNYKWPHRSCDSKSYEKYNSSDGWNILDEEDDTARIMMGESWCMPTMEDFIELKNNVNVYIDTNTKYAKLTGPNGNYITIPISGYLDDKGLNGKERTYCLWSSTFDTNYDDNIGGLNSFAYVENVVTSKARIIAMPVRGIMKKQQ